VSDTCDGGGEVSRLFAEKENHPFVRTETGKEDENREREIV
jgi:hypothetical protein